MKNEPRCPWCGSVMSLRTTDNRPTVPPDNPNYWECAKDWQFVAYYTCTHCSQRTGTIIKSPQAHSSSIEGAVNAAYAEAMARPPAKPMTLQEIISYQDPVWVEFRLPGGHGWSLGVCTAQHRAEQYIRFYEIKAGEYGKDYRFWKTRPTNEERAAAPWEDAGDADL